MSATSIQDQAIARYNKNLAYFREHHPEVYKKIFLLDTAIVQGQYQEKYILEYKDEGYFDIKSTITGTYLYEEDARNYSTKLVSYINKSKEKRVIEGFYRHYFTKQDVLIAKVSDPTCCVESCTLPIIDYVYDHIRDKKYMRHIKKFIFFGTGLGYHLPLVDNEIKEPAIYLVVEDDLEMFRLSLFVTDYTSISMHNNHVFFSVADDTMAFRKVFDNFFDMGYLHNSYLKYLMFFDSYQEKFNQIQTFIVGQSYLGYTYDRLLQKYITALKPIREDYKFLNISKKFDSTVFEEKPVLFLAAGSSLQKHMKWLKDNHEKYILISVFMILPILEKEGITPDIVIHIDEQYKPIQRVLDQVDLTTYATETLFIFSPSIDIDWFKKYSLKDRTFLLEDRTHYKIDHGFLQAASVGETGYALSLIFGAKEIYLLGLDLSFDEESGQSHINGHDGGMSLEKESENVSLRETFLRVKGNFRESVVTNPLFHESILYANMLTRQYKADNQIVYNLNDGAYLEELQPLQVDNIKEQKNIDKVSLRETLYKDLQKFSSTLMPEELELFQIRYENIIKKRKSLKKFLKQTPKNYEDFINKFIELSIDLTINSENQIAQMEQILSVYLHYAGVYIAEFTNTAGVKYNKKIFSVFQNLIVEQLEKIIVKYQKEIEKIL